MKTLWKIAKGFFCFVGILKVTWEFIWMIHLGGPKKYGKYLDEGAKALEKEFGW